MTAQAISVTPEGISKIHPFSHQQVSCVGNGGVEQLRVIPSDYRRNPGPEEVAISVEYAGLCFADIAVRTGMYPVIPPYPFVPGYECAGVVERVGSSVDMLKVGDRVVGMLPKFGAFSQYVVANQREVAAIPESVSSQLATCLPVNYLTASLLIDRLGHAKTGELVAVSSAAGGVGTAVLDLGKRAGLQMIGIASKGKHEVIRARGAIAVDYRETDFANEVRRHAPNGVDLFIDNVGGEMLSKGYGLLRRGGRLVSNGALSIRGSNRNDFLPILLAVYGRKLIPDGKKTAFNSGVAQFAVKEPAWYQTTLRKMIDLVAMHEITPLIGHILPLAEIAKAHTLLETGQSRGKILLDCRRQ